MINLPLRHLFYRIKNSKLDTTGANTSSIKPLTSCTRTRFFVLWGTFGLARSSKASLYGSNIRLFSSGMEMCSSCIRLGLVNVEMWWWRWWWWWWRENNTEFGVGGGGRKHWNFVLVNLYKCSTFFLFLSLHSAPEELTWVCSVLSVKNLLVERIVCKGTWCLNTAMLVSPDVNHFQYFHKNVSGFASSIFSSPWLPEWPGPEKRPEFNLKKTVSRVWFYC